MAVDSRPSGTGTSAEERAAVRAAFFSSPHKRLRPILTFINGDNCWLVSVPRPVSERASDSNGRFYFHIVLDPWLFGQAVYKSKLVLHFTQQTPPAIPDVSSIGAEIDDVSPNLAFLLGSVSWA